MHRNAIIISIIGVLVVAGAVVGILWFINNSKDNQDNNSSAPKPGDTVSINETPNFKTCEAIPEKDIKQILGATISSLSSGNRSGIIAHNLEKAEVCTYEFTVNESTPSRLMITTYPYTTNDASETTNVFDSSWHNITSFEFKEYKLTYPAYFKKTSDESNTEFALQIVSGPKHYRFSISQPNSQITYNEKQAAEALIQLAVKTNYNAANDDKAPPSPSPAPKPTKIETPPLPDHKD